ncbi:MAG: methenyltetrahydromethanopterin cyclohydrolase [Chloroflexota bacterium]|jgi:methenyltetrahydromethanopterin cyclohydrolase
MTLSLNERALEVTERLIADAKALNVTVENLPNGSRLVDCGIEVPGGLQAGILFAEICMGGLGSIQSTYLNLDGWWMPGLAVSTDQPALACMAAQYAGWSVSKDDYFAMGSGPARIKIRAEEALYDELGYDDPAGVAVLCLETRTAPTADIAAYIAERAGISPGDLTLLMAPTACLVGSVQVAARVVETGLHKMHELGFDLHQIVSGYGTCPLPPIAKSDTRAIGRTNDAILYGGQVYYTVVADDEELEEMVAKVPSSTSSDYGEPFYDTFKGYNYDFYKIDPLLFSPAEIFVTNVNSGRTFHSGAVNVEVLKKSFVE